MEFKRYALLVALCALGSGFKGIGDARADDIDNFLEKHFVPLYVAQKCELRTNALEINRLQIAHELAETEIRRDARRAASLAQRAFSELTNINNKIPLELRPSLSLQVQEGGRRWLDEVSQGSSHRLYHLEMIRTELLGRRDEDGLRQQEQAKQLSSAEAAAILNALPQPRGERRLDGPRFVASVDQATGDLLIQLTCGEEEHCSDTPGLNTVKRIAKDNPLTMRLLYNLERDDSQKLIVIAADRFFLSADADTKAWEMTLDDVEYPGAPAQPELEIAADRTIVGMGDFIFRMLDDVPRATPHFDSLAAAYRCDPLSRVNTRNPWRAPYPRQIPTELPESVDPAPRANSAR